MTSEGNTIIYPCNEQLHRKCAGMILNSEVNKSLNNRILKDLNVAQ